MPETKMHRLEGRLVVQVKAPTEAAAIEQAEAKVRKLFDQSAKRMQAEITFRPATEATVTERPKAAPSAWTRVRAALTRPLLS